MILVNVTTSKYITSGIKKNIGIIDYEARFIKIDEINQSAIYSASAGR